MSNKRGSFLFLGAIIGFIAGLFLAPKKGSQLRQETKDKFFEIKENPQDVLHETISDIKEKVNSVMGDENDNENIKISEEEIVISKSFNDEEIK